MPIARPAPARDFDVSLRSADWPGLCFPCQIDFPGQSCCCHWAVASLQSPDGCTKHVQRICLRSSADTCVAARGAGACGSLAGTSAENGQRCCGNGNHSTETRQGTHCCLKTVLLLCRAGGASPGNGHVPSGSLCRVLAPCESRSSVVAERRLGAGHSFVSRAIGTVIKCQAAAERSLNEAGSRDDALFLRKCVKVWFGLVSRESFQIKNFSVR